MRELLSLRPVSSTPNRQLDQLGLTPRINHGSTWVGVWFKCSLPGNFIQKRTTVLARLTRIQRRYFTILAYNIKVSENIMFMLFILKEFK
jgi:hypothetical protein